MLVSPGTTASVPQQCGIGGLVCARTQQLGLAAWPQGPESAPGSPNTRRWASQYSPPEQGRCPLSIDGTGVGIAKRVLDHLTRHGRPGHARTPPRDTTVPVAKRLYTIPITDHFGARAAHEVTDEAFAASRAAGQGQYQALCGCVFTAAAMAAPVGRPCPECLDLLSASRRAAASAAPRRPRHRRDGLLRRMVLACRPRQTTPGKHTTR
jgi:hypothetical protein